MSFVIRSALLIFALWCGSQVPAHAKEVMFEQYFPQNNAQTAESGWRIRYEVLKRENGYGNSQVWHFQSVDFMRGRKDGQPDWVRILNNLALAEIYVPYNDGTYVLDITPQPSWGGGNELPWWLSYRFLKAKPSYLPPNNTAAKIMPDEYVVSELVDDGVRYMDGRRDNDVRRGQVLWLWATLSAGNYRYVLKYGFADDGTISVRAGGTAENLRNDKQDPTNRAVHLHMGCWRMEFALGPPEQNKIEVAERNADLTNGTAEASHRHFNNDMEGGELWVAEKFTALMVMNMGTMNLHKPPRNVGYKLLPLRSGSARSNQRYTKYDFWVTRRDPDSPARKNSLPELKFVDVPENVSAPEPIAGKATVIWYTSALNHLPRTEDFGEQDYRRRQGVAILMSTGFDLMPHDLWHKTPFLERK